MVSWNILPNHFGGKWPQTICLYICCNFLRPNQTSFIYSFLVVATQTFFYFHPNPWGDGPIWLYDIFKWVETTNQVLQHDIGIGIFWDQIRQVSFEGIYFEITTSDQTIQWQIYQCFFGGWLLQEGIVFMGSHGRLSGGTANCTFNVLADSKHVRELHPRSWTYPLKIDGWTTTFLLKRPLFRGHAFVFGGGCCMMSGDVPLRLWVGKTPGAIYHEQPREVGWLSTYAFSCEGGDRRKGWKDPEGISTISGS